MPYVPHTTHLGFPPIASTRPASTEAGRSTPGPWANDIIRADDPTYGTGEFIYLKGVASTVVGSVVTYDALQKQTALAPATGGNGPVAVAMSANVANQWGWYQIAGAAVVKAPNAMTVGADVFMLAATPGSVDDAQVNGEQIIGAKVASTTGTPSAGLGVITINRPYLQGQVV